MTQKSLMIHKSFIVLRVLSNESVEFDDPKECDDPQISNEPKGISIGRKYLDLVIQNLFFWICYLVLRYGFERPAKYWNVVIFVKVQRSEYVANALRPTKGGRQWENIKLFMSIRRL